ncbi:MAG: response regulator [Flavobacteriales bacterium]|jgi:DNA-binding NtrC family response regulator
MNLSRYILIVDDEYIILEALRIQLERNLPGDVIIESASGYEEAVSIMKEIVETNNKISAVISDYNLGEIKGSEVLRAAKQHFPQVKKAILTGHASIDDLAGRDPDVHLDAFFTKPWSTDEVVQFVMKSFE